MPLGAADGRPVGAVVPAEIERVRGSKVIHTDDTPVPVLDPALPKTRTARFWVYCGDWRNPYTVYDYTTSRKRDGPASHFRTFHIRSSRQHVSQSGSHVQ